MTVFFRNWTSGISLNFTIKPNFNTERVNATLPKLYQVATRPLDPRSTGEVQLNFDKTPRKTIKLMQQCTREPNRQYQHF